MKNKQIQQITQFLSAYPVDVVETGIKAWRNGEIPEVMEGRVTDIPMAQKLNELTEEAKQFMKEESERMQKIMPFCKCGKQLNLVGVCGGCPHGKEGYKSKFVCSCGFEEFFKETVYNKIIELKGGM